MRLFLAFAVTFSFLAGQACGNGVRAFQPLAAEEEGIEFMSRMIVRCDAQDTEQIAGTSADCGPGQCVEGAKDEPDDAGIAVQRMEELSSPPIATLERSVTSLIIAHAAVAAVQPELSRPVLQVRRE